MSRCTIYTDLHIPYYLSHEVENLATNVTLLNSSHKGPEPQSALKYLVQNQSHYKTDFNGKMKGDWAFAAKASYKCDLAYL